VARAGTAFDGRHLYQLAEDRIQKIDPKTARSARSRRRRGSANSGLAWAEGPLVGKNRDRTIHQVDPLPTIESNRFGPGRSL